MILVHGSNLAQKETHLRKYSDETSRKYLTEIRHEYDKWHIANTELIGPGIQPADNDREIIEQRVKLLEDYKSFIDQQQYAEQFDSRSNLHSSVLEEFLYYLFRDIVADFGSRALIGKSHSFKDMFFKPPNYQSMTNRPFAAVEVKDHDFVIGVTVEARFQLGIQQQLDSEIAQDGLILEAKPKYITQIEAQAEKHFLTSPQLLLNARPISIRRCWKVLLEPLKN